MNTDQQAIRDLIATWHHATAAGEVEVILELMSEDVVFLVAGQPPMRGRQGFEKAIRGLFVSHRIESAFEIQELQVSGDLAYCWSHLTIRLISLSDGATVTRVGNVLSILHKNESGVWQVVRDANMLALAPSSEI